MNTRQAGMTLVELMVALTVAIVLMAIGIPAFQNLQANNRVAAQVNGLVTGLNLARAEAVARGTGVSVCGKATKGANDTTCGGSGSLTGVCTPDQDDANPWCNGLVVFTDAGEVIRVFAPPGGLPVFSASAASVRFNSRGEQAAAAAFSMQINQQSASSAQVRCLRVGLGGLIATVREPCT